MCRHHGLKGLAHSPSFLWKQHVAYALVPSSCSSAHTGVYLCLICWHSRSSIREQEWHLSLEVGTMIRQIILLPEVVVSLVLNINHSWDLCFWLANRCWDLVLYVLTTDTWTDKHITLPPNNLFKELIPGERWASKQLSRSHLSIPSATL